MFKRNDLNNFWLAPSDDKTDEKKEKRRPAWVWIKRLIKLGCFILKILDFFNQDSP